MSKTSNHMDNMEPPPFADSLYSKIFTKLEAEHVPKMFLKCQKNWASCSYHVFKCNCNAQNLYHGKTAWAINVRIFSSFSKLLTVLYWVALIIKKINDQFDIQGRIYSDNWEKYIFFIKMGLTLYTLFGVISKRIELQSCAWSRIVDNLM